MSDFASFPMLWFTYVIKQRNFEITILKIIICCLSRVLAISRQIWEVWEIYTPFAEKRL